PSSVSAERKVVITGIGPVTPIGIGVDDFWAGAISGRSGIRRITRVDPSDLPVKLAGEVDGFDVSNWLDAKEARRTDRFAHLSIATSNRAGGGARPPAV